MKDFEFLPRFYHDILLFFDELKTLYGYKGISNLFLFNNRDILIDEKPFFFQEWFAAGIKTIMDLLDTDGQFLSFPDLKAKFSLPKTSFLHYYQVVSAIPNFLFKRAKELIRSSIETPLDEVTSFHLDESMMINPLNIKSKDFYWLLINKIHTGLHAGPKRWTKSVPLSSINWQTVFSTIGKCSKEKKTVNFIVSLFTESLSPKKNYLDLNLRMTVTVFTVERQILLITPLLIACLQNHSARKCCHGLMLLTPPPFHSVLRNCFLVW